MRNLVDLFQPGAARRLAAFFSGATAG
jgi:hypothetical protein